MALSPERLALLEELRRRIGERARTTPKSKPSEPRAPPRLPAATLNGCGTGSPFGRGHSAAYCPPMVCHLVRSGPGRTG
ncbi:hypothetical protein [Streptomyces sp. IBSBF 2435]|uniref:hypothetical protein n=1 Tax=Streptomyces sp. IBSBF 2435 TaxID=2903531 RepID=UPI002FDC07AD